MRDLVGLAVQLHVGDVPPFATDSNGVGCARGALLKQSVQALVAAVIFAIVPLIEQPQAFVIRQQTCGFITG